MELSLWPLDMDFAAARTTPATQSAIFISSRHQLPKLPTQQSQEVQA